MKKVFSFFPVYIFFNYYNKLNLYMDFLVVVVLSIIVIRVCSVSNDALYMFI